MHLSHYNSLKICCPVRKLILTSFQNLSVLSFLPQIKQDKLFSIDQQQKFQMKLASATTVLGL